MNNKNIFGFNYIFPFSLLFILLYFEHFSIGMVKISQVWKLPIYIFFIFYIIKYYNEKTLIIPNYVFYSFLLFIIISINTSSPINYINNLSEAFSILTLPLSIAYFKIKQKTNPNKIELFVISFSSFLILYNLPFIFDLIPETNSTHDLSKYGLEGKVTLTGVFYHTNITSKINVVATLVIMFSRKHFRGLFLKRIIYWLLCSIGVYSIYLNYTRTGWMLLLFGIFFILLYKENLKRIFLIAIPIFLIFVYSTYLFILNNPAIILRLVGATTYRTNDSYDSNQISSGRIAIWEHAIQNLKKDGIPAIVFGHGVKRAYDLMEESYGYSIPAHNRFIEILQYGGILSLLLYLKILQLVYFEVRKVSIISGNYKSKLPLALFFILIIATIPSHGLPLWSEIILGGLIVGGLQRSPNLDHTTKTQIETRV